jgi:cobalamin synthase
MGVIIKASRDTDLCVMHDMRVRPCAVHQLCQVHSQRVMTISCVCSSSILTKSYDINICVGQVSSQRAMMLSAVWDKYPHKELWYYRLYGISILTKSYDIISCVGQVSSNRAMILSAVWDKYPHKRSMTSVSHIQMKMSLRPVSTAQISVMSMYKFFIGLQCHNNHSRI